MNYLKCDSKTGGQGHNLPVKVCVKRIIFLTFLSETKNFFAQKKQSARRSRIGVFVNPFQKNDGFGGTHRTHANRASVTYSSLVRGDAQIQSIMSVNAWTVNFVQVEQPLGPLHLHWGHLTIILGGGTAPG